MGKMPVLGMAGLLAASVVLSGCGWRKQCESCNTDGSSVSSGHAWNTAPKNGAAGTQGGSALTSTGSPSSGFQSLGSAPTGTGRPTTGSMGGAPYNTTGMSGSPYGGTVPSGAPLTGTGGMSTTTPLTGSSTTGSSQFRGVTPNTINRPTYDTNTTPGRVAPVDGTQPTSGSSLGGSGGAQGGSTIHQVTPGGTAPVLESVPSGSQSKLPSSMPPGVSGMPTNPVGSGSGPTIQPDPE